MMKAILFLLSFAFIQPSYAQISGAEGTDRPSEENILKAENEIRSLMQNAVWPDDLSEPKKNEILDRYSHLDPTGQIPKVLLNETILFFDQNKKIFKNKNFFAIINYWHRSDAYRFFVVDLKSGRVDKYHTTHGEGSDLDKDGVAERFSNVVGSHASSLGFARTGETYYGQFKRSLRLDGLSASNAKLRERAIVIHGWDGAHEANVLQGLTWGCPALDWSVKDSVIDRIKDGALLNMGSQHPW